MGRVTDDSRSRCSERMAESDRAPVDIHLLGVQIRPALQTREGLRRERLVQLEQIDI